MSELRSMTLTELTKLRRDLLAEIKARRPRAPKVTVRKQRSVEEREQRKAWKEFRRECDYGYCWACGRTTNDRPEGWDLPWGIERMHFVHSGTGRRIQDRRLAIAACSGCHKRYHARIAWELPPLTDGQCAFLKKAFDRENFDPFFIAANNIRGGIALEKLPDVFTKSFMKFQMR